MVLELDCKGTDGVNRVTESIVTSSQYQSHCIRLIGFLWLYLATEASNHDCVLRNRVDIGV